MVHARRRITSASSQDTRVDRTDPTKYSVVVTGWCGEVKCCVWFALRATEEVHWPGRLRTASRGLEADSKGFRTRETLHLLDQ